MKNDSTNMTIKYLKYCCKYNFILLWNGSSDWRILLRLGIKCIMFDLTAYDEYNDKIIYLA